MTDAPPLDRSTVFKLLQLVNLVAKPFGRLHARRHDLPLTDWRVMLTLASRPGMTAAEVADLLGLDRMAVSRAVRALERQGRLARTTDPEDGRRAHLALTAAGHAVHRDIAPSGQAREAALLADLDPEERAAFERMLDRLLARARSLPDAQNP
jgi:DNA-binding MarR family transcriptional regulator